MLSFLMPDPSILKINTIHCSDQRIELTMNTTQCWAYCPNCLKPSIRVHSSYERTVADLPAGGCRVVILLSVRRFFCDEDSCQKRTFTERIPSVVEHYARKTIRLVLVQSRIGFVIGGEAGSRISLDLSLATSPDTLLRNIRSFQEPAQKPVNYLGVDDWAFRKQTTYGTILVNLETHRPIELLPDRNTVTLAQWLKEHPEIKMITRDRFPAYIEAMHQGAPNAIQIADRWHLLHNLTEAVERSLSRHYKTLKEIFREPGETNQDNIVVNPVETKQIQPISPPQCLSDQNRQVNREKKMIQFQEVKQLSQQGMGIREIQRQLHMSRRRVRKYLQNDELPDYKRRRMPALLDPYWEYVIQRWQSGCRKGIQLWQEVKEKGYKGTYQSFARRIRGLRDSMPSSKSKLGNKNASKKPINAPRPPSPRQLAWLFVRSPENLNKKQSDLLKTLLDHSQEFDEIYGLAQAFYKMVKEKKKDELMAWISQAQQTGHSDIKYFARGLVKDIAAVEAALTYDWSNGVVEGNNNRLKMIKRQMYGRAKFDLLRLRVLYS